jgi:hypothetical protein
MAISTTLLIGFILGAVSGFILRKQIENLIPGAAAIGAQGFHEGVWYDDLAAKPIEHTIFGPFQNEYEDPLAGITPSGLTPPPVDIKVTMA